MATKLIAIVGPTASGKSSLAMYLAQKFDGEIIAADSRTIYKGMDIGTAKPTFEDRQQIRHHCLDLITPDQRYSVYDFKLEAEAAISDIRSRNKVPLLVGGTGLYVDAVAYDYDFETGEIDEDLPEDLESLQLIAQNARYDVPEQIFMNPRHLRGFIRRGGRQGTKSESETLFIGVNRSREELIQRIEKRVEIMLEQGFIQEVRELEALYGPGAPGFSSPGYRPFLEFLSSKISEQQAIDLFIQEHKALAKRQNTWFNKNKSIQWVTDEFEAEQLIRVNTL